MILHHFYWPVVWHLGKWINEMTEINLLPWRELRREKEKKKLTVYLTSGLVVSTLLISIVNYFVLSNIDEQASLNRRLEAEIATYKKQLIQIKELKKLREGLIARMNIVQNLQATRTMTVRLFDEVIRIMPNDVYVTRMERIGNKILLAGYTESNANISVLMRNIEASRWIQSPALTEIKKVKEGQDDSPSEFKLSFILQSKNT